MKVKVIIADDHTIVREGLCALLARQQDFQVVAEAADGRTAVRLTQELLPDVVVMDINMSELNGIEATRQIVSGNPGIKVIALSMYSEKRFVVEMLHAGASGYIPKNSAFEELIRAIYTVMDGQMYLSPSITTFVAKEYIQQSSKTNLLVFSILTSREREVLQLIAEGKTTKEIASILNVSTKTIETHRQHIMKKLNMHNIAELIKYAISEGITRI
jgi:DNA-binding NarL/FixJ family response regulator